MKYVNDSSQQQDLESSVGLYIFIGCLVLFAVGLFLYVYYGS